MLSTIIAEKSITDIVLYGDTRPIHAEAIKLAKALDLRVHVFEKGYLRPLAKIQGSFATKPIVALKLVPPKRIRFGGSDMR